MKIAPRSALLPAALVCLLAVSGCSSADSDAAPVEASATASASTSAAPTTSGSSAASTSASSSTSENPAAALEQTFTSPDGALSFRYPAGWTVIATTNQQSSGTSHRTWALNDTDAQLVLTLDVRTYTPPAGPPPLTTVVPQGPVPGVLDGLGAPTQAVVAATPGQSWGSNGRLVYGLAAGTGADTTLFSLRWGNYYLLSFSGSQDLGRPASEGELAAEAEELAASARFRTEILPILQSLTASTPPTPDGQDESAEIPADTWSAAPDTDADAAGMTPGDIGRWAEELEEEYLAQYGYTEFMDAEEDTGSAPSAIITFDATTYGELRVYTWGWISEADAQTVAEDVASAMAGLPDAPHTVTVSNGADDPTLATATVND